MTLQLELLPELINVHSSSAASTYFGTLCLLAGAVEQNGIGSRSAGPTPTIGSNTAIVRGA